MTRKANDLAQDRSVCRGTEPGTTIHHCWILNYHSKDFLVSEYCPGPGADEGIGSSGQESGCMIP